jgi:DNA phosphorothioation-associated putative methyltransferase
MARTALSRPLACALDDGVVTADTTVFDYGCGRGGDVQRLTALGIHCAGWDPAHRPSTERQAADVVNLGYVVNVIDNPSERRDTLAAAWALTGKVLVVAARLTWEARELQGRPFADGIITSTGTFQKFYAQNELRSWIEETTSAPTIAAAPGILYVFRDHAAAQTLLADRVHRASRSYEPWINQALFDQHRELLQPLIAFLTRRGRLPRPGELPDSEPVRRIFGSLARAFAVITAATDPHQWEQLFTQRAADLLVYLALARFDGRPRFTDLPTALQYDIRQFCGTYQSGCQKADRLLVTAGNTDAVDLAACASPVGKLTPSALYVHHTALGDLPPVLRVLDGCAKILAGTIPGANLIKINREQPLVSYLTYSTFDTNPHPVLATAVTVNLRKLTVDRRDYRVSANPPLLHRKEEFIAEDHPLRERFTRLTMQEVRCGLYEAPERIGTSQGWQKVLDEHDVKLRGHRLVYNRNIPSTEVMPAKPRTSPRIAGLDNPGVTQAAE